MNNKYRFFIAGKTRNKENILKICSIFEELNIPHYCFLKNEESHKEAGLDINDKKLADTFESLNLEDRRVRKIFEHDLNGEKTLIICCWYFQLENRHILRRALHMD